jgi:hypothetical protein
LHLFRRRLGRFASRLSLHESSTFRLALNVQLAMGVSMSTLVGWAVIGAVAGYYWFVSRQNDTRRRDAVRASGQRQRIEDRQPGKDAKDKAKRQRAEAYSKDAEDSVEKTSKAKSRPSKATSTVPTSSRPTLYSSDDGVDNREFARQLSSVKQGTNLNGPKKNDEQRQKSVKQSRAREMEYMAKDGAEDHVVSAPSSTAGVDADDDESPVASPDIKAVDAGGVADMLEPAVAGPSVLRLTGTDKVKQKEKKAVKEADKAETKRQRQHRQKAEAAKALREETEKQRKVQMEAQRRLARISEGRAAQDGSAFMAAQAQGSVWNANGTNGSQHYDEGVNGTPKDDMASGKSLPVQPLDTFEHTSTPKTTTTPVVAQRDSWMASLPSEEEQLEMIRDEEAWSTVTTKKSSKPKKKEATVENTADVDSAVSQPQQVAPVTQQPAVTKLHKANGKPARVFTQQSSFAALRNSDEAEAEEAEAEEAEEEWDI